MTGKELLEKYNKRRQGNNSSSEETTKTNSSSLSGSELLERYRKSRGLTTSTEEETASTTESAWDKYKEFANSEEGAKGWEKYLADQEASRLAAEEEQNSKSWWEKLLEGYLDSQKYVSNDPLAGTMNAAIETYRNDVSYKRPKDDWSEEQKNIFGYLYSTNRGEAYQYAEATNNLNNKAKEDATIQKIQDSATSNFWAGAGHTVGAIATAPLALGDFLNDLAMTAAGREITSDGFVTPFEYSQAVTGGISTHLNEKGGTIDESVPIIGGKGWGDVYGLGTSIAQSAASAYTLGSVGTLVSYFGQGAASGVDDALSRGASEEQAVIYGTILGVAEGLAEQIGIDNLFKLGASPTLKVAIKNILKQAGAEGLEEGLTSIISNIADNAIMQDQSNFNAMVKAYMEQGMTEDKAKQMAWMDSIEGIAYDTLAGAVSGGVHAGAHTGVLSAIDNHKVSQQYGDNKSIQDLLTDAVNTGGEAGNVADKLLAKYEKKGKLSGANLNELLYTTDTTKMKLDIEAKLTEHGETGDISAIADVLVRQATGEELSSKDWNTLNNSKAGHLVSSELNADNIKSGALNDDWATYIGTKSINPQAYNRGVYDFTKMVAGAKDRAIKASVTKELAESGGADEANIEVSDNGKNMYYDAETDSYLDADIKSIVSTKGGIKVELENGKTVSASDLRFASREEGVVYEMLARMDVTPETANEIINTFKPSNPRQASLYYDSIPLAYRMGLMGNEQGLKYINLTDAQKRIVYNRGRIDAVSNAKERDNARATSSNKAPSESAKTGKNGIIYEGDFSYDETTANDLQRAGMAGAEAIAKTTNLEVHVFESFIDKDGNRVAYVNGKLTSAPNGYFTGGNKIYIDINAGMNAEGAMLYALSHEVTHYIRKWNAQGFKDLADFLIAEYGKQGVDITGLIQRQKDKIKKRHIAEETERIKKQYELEGKAIPNEAELEKMASETLPNDAKLFDMAYEELVADAMSDMFADPNAYKKLAKFKKKNYKAWKKLGEVIRQVLDKLKNALGLYRNNSPVAQEAFHVRDFSVEAYNKLQDLYIKAFVEADNNYSSAEQTLVESGIAVNPETESASLLSVRDVLDDEQREKVSSALATRFGVTKEEAMDWLKAETSMASLILNPKYSQYLDYAPDPNEVAIKTNSDYPQGTVDFSPICAKRREFTSVMNNILRLFPNHVFAATDLAKIRTIMQEEGMTIPCGICYVEDRRQLDTIVAQNFIDSLKLYREGSKTRPDGKPFNANQLKGLSLIDGDSYIPSVYELVSLEGLNVLKEKNPNMAEAWVKFNNARGMQSVRLLANEAEYKRQILKYSKKTVQSKNDHGGLRVYSFSDAEMFHLIDIIQVITDSATVGLSLQGYTKVNEYAKAVKDTGEKLNRSLIPKGELGYHIEDGMVVLDYDTVEGIDINHPDFFDNRDNPNVGNITIGVSDVQIRAAMVSDFVDQIIPFHTGQSEEVLGEKGISTWFNYKDFQTEKDIATGKVSEHQINIYTEVLQVLEKEGKPINKRTFVEKFLQVCKDNGLTPRFSQFLNTNENGEYVYTEGYHKMLVDFKTFAQTEVGEYLPQMPVKPIFDNEYITKILKDYVKSQKVKDAELAESMPKVIERITNEIVKPSEDGQQSEVKYSDRVLMGSLFSGGGTLEAGLVYQMLDKEFAVEYNKQIASTYTDNHGKEHMFVGDVREFNSKEKQSVFYLHASPVCKNYSAASHSGGETTLDITTAQATARVLEEQMPRVFTVENVKRYIGSEAYNLITNKLDELGYTWDVAVYKASDYGNATKRERMIIRAVKDGQLPPKPQKASNITSWGEATRDLWETDLIPSNLVKSKIEAIKNTPELKKLRLTKLDKPLMIYDTTKSKQINYAWADELAPTLTTKCGDARIIMPDGRVYAPTPKFMGRIQGLPDDYKYPKAVTNAFKIIGNGIPTQLTKAVMGGVLDSAYEQTHDGQVLYSGRDSEGNVLSAEQQEFFKDSKIRDKKGNLLVVRHGTDADFNIFDFSKSGKNGKAEGYGFYFSDDPEITNRYGAIQKELYLNITKPLYNNKRTITKAELKKLTNALIDFDIEKYKSDGLTWQDSFLSNFIDTYEFKKSRQYAVQEFVNQIWDYDTNDQDLVFEIAQADGRTYESSMMKEFYNVLTDSIGYDGIIAEWSHPDGTSNVYVTFSSEQSKYTTNKTPTPDPDMRYSNRDNIGYHAGDLGKAEFLHQQGYSRGTGHFGTGTYFVGDEERISGDNNYGNRPHHAVDFSNYNLYKVKDDKDGYELHEQLRVIDGGISQEWITAAENDQFNLVGMTDVYDLAEKRFGEDKYSDEAMESAILELAEKHGIELLSREEYSEEYGISLDDEDFSFYYLGDYLKDTFRDEAERINSYYKEFRSAYFSLKLRFGFGDKVAKALKAVLEYQNANADTRFYGDKKDSLATVFMKSLGYEGIDVRGTRLDNVQYGSVIYDLKEDTIIYSERDTDSVSNRSLLANALESVAQNDIEKNKLNEYKKKISLIESEQKKLNDLKAEANNLRFTKGRTAEETKKMHDLDFEANQTANRINTYDKQLLNLESTKALKNVLEREKTNLRKRLEKQGKEALKAQSAKNAETVREIMNRNTESRKKAVEGRHKTEMKNSIRKLLKRLNKLLKGGKESNVKEEMKETVATALALGDILFSNEISNRDIVNLGVESVTEKESKLLNEYRDLLTKKALNDERIESIRKGEIKEDSFPYISDLEEANRRYERRIAVLNKELADVFVRERARLNRIPVSTLIYQLATEYHNLKTSDVEYIRDAYNDELFNKLIDLKKTLGGTTARDMSMDQLEKVHKVFTMIEHSVRTANQEFRNGKWEDLQENASKVMEEIDRLKDAKAISPDMAAKLKSYLWNELTPYYAFDKIGSDTLMGYFWDLIKGQSVAARDFAEANNFASATREKYGYNKWELDKVYDFKLMDGRTFSTTLKHLLSVYAYSKREQADLHMSIGGFFHNDKATFRKEKGILKMVRTDAVGYKVDDAVLAQIKAVLGNEKMSYVDEMVDYLTKMGEKGNEVTRVMWGVDIFTEKVYFPLKSKDDFLKKSTETATAVSLKNDGMTKETVPGANNPIVLEAFDDVWANHVEKMSTYHGLVIPIDNLNKVLHYGTWVGTDAMSVSTMLEGKFTSAVTDYLEQWINDLNGGTMVKGATNPFMSFFSKFKKTVVGASLSTVVQQPTAVLRAMAEIDAKYFVGKPNLTKLNEQWEEFRKYAPIAIIKEIGGFDAGGGKSASRWINSNTLTGVDKVMNTVDDISMKGAEVADKIGWLSIWNAVKREIADTTNIKVDSQEFLDKCGERATEVIVKTQVYDSTLSRSGFMRSKNDGVKMITSFMGEPTLSLNMMYSAVINAFRGGKEAKIKAAKTIGFVYLAIVLAEALSSAIYALRDDDEDESYMEKYLQSFGGSVVSDIALAPVTSLPGVKDVISIFQGWDVERSDMAIFKDIKDAFDGLDSESKSPYRKVEDFAGAIAAAFGVPLKNVLRTGREVYNAGSHVFDDVSGGGAWDAFAEGITGKSSTDSKKLYKAVLKGDASRYRNQYKTEAAYETAIRNALRDNDSRINEAAQARYEGDIAEYTRIAKEIIREGNFSQDIVVSAINAELNAIKRGETTAEEPTEDKDEITSLYSGSDINSAFDNGDFVLGKQIISDLIETKVANGMEQNNAKSSLRSSMTSYWKPLYKEAYQSGDTNEMARIRQILYASGLYGSANEVVKTTQSWLKS